MSVRAHCPICRFARRWLKKSGLLGFILAVALPLYAHESRPAYLELTEIDAETVQVVWKMPAQGSVERISLTPRFPADAVYVATPAAEFVNQAYLERSTLRRPGGWTGAEIHIEGLSRTLTDALLRFERLDGSTQIFQLKPDAPSVVINATPGSWQVAGTYTVLGVEHIWAGIDHLLFVACLLLVAGISRKLVITITGFTVAHSMTLALATLDLVRIPVPPVEAVIALSIVFLAREIAGHRQDSLTYRYPVAVSMSFGLLHGFGFAAVLNEIGLPAADVPIALLFFNGGVEIGQLLFIALLIAPVILWRRRFPPPAATSPATQPRWRWAEVPAAYTIGTVAMWWTIERVISFWV